MAKSAKPAKLNGPAKPAKGGRTAKAAHPAAVSENGSKKTALPLATMDARYGDNGGFPVVGICCSAGRLEAPDLFSQNVPEDTGMAFVVVQHLDPHDASTLPERLRYATHLNVAEAKNRVKVRPGNVYIIPPDRELTILHDTRYLLEPPESHGQRMTGDYFLHLLAANREESAIGVSLSGVGSDGVLGLRAIKEKGGLILAQDPAEAKAAGIPKAGIDEGPADIIGPAATLPAQIRTIIKQPAFRARGVAAPAARSSLEQIVIMLRDRRGADFSGYKTRALYRRIERRTALHQLGGIAAYVSYLRHNAQELDMLLKELLIGVTKFFRDPPVWDALRDTVLPELFKKRPQGATLRAWVPACSSGEEAYSLAMVFREALEKFKPERRFTLQIYATDIDGDAIDKARSGAYAANISEDVPPERLTRFFLSDGEGYRVGKDIRDMVVFAPQNIISDPPFTKLDILCCRNLLTYLDPPVQKKLVPLFHYALNRDGVLMLGSAETIGTFTDLFDAEDAKRRIFRRLDKDSLVAHLEFPGRRAAELPALAAPEPCPARDSFDHLTEQFIQQNYAPPAVLVTGHGDILHISGRTGKYLEPAAGKMNVNIHAMARPGLREALTGVIRNAQRADAPIQLNGVRVATDGGTATVDVILQGLSQSDLVRGRVLIVFCDVPEPVEGVKGRHKQGAAVSTLELKLEQVRAALKAAHEAMQNSVEEYKSANEELRSTNEELTIPKGELQSLNEELLTVNAELESKMNELSGARNDMTNLLNSTEISAVFLDNGLKLRRFTCHATDLFKLIQSDIGRPLPDIATELQYPELAEDVSEVLSTLAFRERKVGTRAGKRYRVRIMPYRTPANVIDGVVITFIDITEAGEMERKLQMLRAAGERTG